MTTVYVDLVNLDGSRPEGTLRFVLERMVLGDPDVVPSSVEARIRDGKARVEGLLPGDMRVRVSAGDWSKTWSITVPAEGEHDLFKLLGEQAPEFEHALWATLLGRVEALESAPVVDLAPLEERVTALEQEPGPAPFDPSALQDRLAELQAHLTPVSLDYDDGIVEDLVPLWGGRLAGLDHTARWARQPQNQSQRPGGAYPRDGWDGASAFPGANVQLLRRNFPVRCMAVSGREVSHEARPRPNRSWRNERDRSRQKGRGSSVPHEGR